MRRTGQTVLLFTKTTGFRHDSIQEGTALVEELAQRDGLVVEHTEDEDVFTAEHLADVAAVVWLQVSGDVLTDTGRVAFEEYLRAGGGFAGVHGAADAEPSWPAYEDVVGARFLSHPQGELQRQAALVVAEADHPSTRPVPAGWTWHEEWYVFTRNPRGRCEVLLRVDESTYDPQGAPMGPDHPVSWAGRHGRGRTWYTALGHDAASYRDPVFREHVWGGITSVLRDV